METALVQHISLAADANALRRGEASPSDLIDRLQKRFERINSAIDAFLPEANRFECLRRDAASLEERFPAP